MKFDDSGSKKREKYDFGVIFEVPGPENPQNSGNCGEIPKISEILDFYDFPLPVPMGLLNPKLTN